MRFIFNAQMKLLYFNVQKLFLQSGTDITKWGWLKTRWYNNLHAQNK